MRQMSSLGRRQRGIFIGILGVFDLLVQMEIDTVVTLVANGQVGEDEVAGLRRTVQVGDTGDGHTSQDMTGLSSGAPYRVDGTNGLQGGKQEEIGVVGESHVALV